MRTLLFLNNWGAWRTARWLQRRGETVVGLVLQPADDRRFGDEILAELNLPPDRVWLSDRLGDPRTVAKLRALRPDIGISAFFGCVLKPELLDIFPRGCVNLHSALLPYNRGWHTNVWPIIEGSPAGATVHYIDAGVDTGDVIAQREIAVAPTETGGSLHEKITRGLVELFCDTWPQIVAGKSGRTRQDHSKATIHKKAELDRISRIELDRTYRARDLINLLRARTYPPYPSAYFIDGDTQRRTFVRLQPLLESQLPSYAAGSTAATRALQVDPNAELPAVDLLHMLGVHDASPHYFARHEHESGPVFLRACIVDEREFDTRAAPAWIGHA